MTEESLTQMPLVGYQIRYDSKWDESRQWSWKCLLLP